MGSTKRTAQMEEDLFDARLLMLTVTLFVLGGPYVCAVAHIANRQPNTPLALEDHAHIAIVYIAIDHPFRVCTERPILSHAVEEIGPGFPNCPHAARTLTAGWSTAQSQLASGCRRAISAVTVPFARRDEVSAKSPFSSAGLCSPATSFGCLESNAV